MIIYDKILAIYCKILVLQRKNIDNLMLNTSVILLRWKLSNWNLSKIDFKSKMVFFIVSGAQEGSAR